MRAKALGELWLEVEGRQQAKGLDLLQCGDRTAVRGRRHQLGQVRPLAMCDARPPFQLKVTLDGPDLSDVLERTGLSQADLHDLLEKIPLRVAFPGFLPGFAYLEGLPPVLHVPRRDTPRKRVPAGSFALGGGYMGVYPSVSPGGWHLIGTSPTPLFDPQRWPPTELDAGRAVVIDVC